MKKAASGKLEIKELNGGPSNKWQEDIKFGGTCTFQPVQYLHVGQSCTDERQGSIPGHRPGRLRSSIGHSGRAKRPEREEYHSCPSNADVKNKRFCTYTPPLAFMTCYLTEHSDNFALAFTEHKGSVQLSQKPSHGTTLNHFKPLHIPKEYCTNKYILILFVLLICV
jgi:hypothetical protein